MRRQTTIAELGLLYSAAIWGSTFYLVKEALGAVDPIVLIAYRFLLAGLMLLIYVIRTRRAILQDIGKGAILATILWFLYVSQTIGLGLTTASNSGFITGLFIVFVPLFLRTIFKRTPTTMEVIAAGVALIGLWVLTGGLNDLNSGDALTLVSAMTYALHLLYSDKYIKDGVDPYVICCQQFILVGGFSLLTALVLDLPLGITTDSGFNIVIFLAIFPTLTAYVVQLLAQRIVSALRVSLIFTLEPVFAALFAWTLGDETFHWQRASGGLLIVVALILSALPTPDWLRRSPKGL